MPRYDYACTECGTRIEVLRGRDEPGPEVCEVCGGRMRKLMSLPAVVYKGTGWAKRDRAPSRASEGTTAEGTTAEAGAKTGGSKESETSSTGDAGETKASGSDSDAKPAAAGSAEKTSSGPGAGHARDTSRRASERPRRSKGSASPAGGGDD